MLIRLATPADLGFLGVHDRHVPPAELDAVVRRGNVLVAASDDGPVGWLRWGLFWDEHPFMNMLFVLDGHRGQGAARRLVEAWEALCREAGHPFVLTSTLVTEQAQHFYRQLGYADAGHLDLPGEPRELILIHRL